MEKINEKTIKDDKTQKSKCSGKKRRIPLPVIIILSVFSGMILLVLIALLVLWIINPTLVSFIFSFVIPNLPKLMTSNNINAAWIMFTNDNAAIVEKLDTNQQQQSETLGVSPEVIAAIESGKYTAEEIELILNTQGAAIAEIDAAKLEASGNNDDVSTETVITDEMLAGLSEEVIAAIKSGEYTEDEITLIIESGGAALEQIDSEKENLPDTPATDAKPDPVPTDTPSTDTPSKSETSSPVTDTPSSETTAPESGVTEEKPPVTPTEPEITTPPTTDVPATEPEKPLTQGEIINKSVAKLYIVKNDFISQLADIESVIRKTYVDLPKEQQVPASRKEIAGRYISAVADLELACDAQVDEILAELKTSLEAIGGDLSIIDTIRAQYEEEKSLKKAYYLDVYQNGLPDKPAPAPAETATP